jgi:hypothetical protein
MNACDNFVGLESYRLAAWLNVNVTFKNPRAGGSWRQFLGFRD